MASGIGTMSKICFVLTSPFALNAFLRPHLELLSSSHDITVCTKVDKSDVAPSLPEGVRLVSLQINRNISLWQDIKTLLRLVSFFRHEQFDLVYSLTPKGGLLAMLAGWLVAVPHRIHYFTGQVWATKRGIGRWFLKTLDRLLVECATSLLADSASQRQYLIDEGVVDSDKIKVLLNGSIAGVDVDRFRPDEDSRRRIRSQFGIGPDECCLLYVGRLKRDKGVPDLVDAFCKLSSRFPNLHLLLIGPDEENLEAICRDIPNVHRVGYTPSVEAYMAAADIFCLPSYREGFGLVLIEAGAAGLPVVASRIYGITDAVVDGETGLLHRPGDVDDLVRTLGLLLQDLSLRRSMGEEGRQRVCKFFAQQQVTAAMQDYLAGLLSANQNS
jgi:glycosyltransferase involved in cell wall biosynthesis